MNESQVLIVSTDDLTKLNQWLNQKQIDSTKYKYELHKECMERVKKDVGANSHEPQLMNDENDENSEFHPNLMLAKLMEEKLLEHMKGAIPAHVPSVIEAFQEYVEGLNYVSDPSKSALEKALQNFILAHPEYAIHTTSKKEGRLLYNLNWDCISNLYDISKTKKDNDLKFDERRRLFTSDQMFHAALEIRNRLKGGSKVSEMYGKYPELLERLTLEQLISRGAIVHFDDENKDPKRIPTLDPFLFNLFHYLICSNDEAKVFEKRFDLTWGKSFLDGYKTSTISTYTRAAVLTCDVLYHHNMNLYPLHVVLFSDLIANTKLTKLINS